MSTRESSQQMESLRLVVNRIRNMAGRKDIDQLLPEQQLQNDLQFDSLDLAELTVLIEAKFGIDVFEDGIVATVQDVLMKLRDR